MPDPQKFVDLGRPKRIWAVGAIHGEVERLVALHDDIGRRFRPGDRLVYLGNYLGWGSAVVETVDELLMFRRALLAMPGLLATDIVYLRGSQEEMWQKLLQLQFAPNPGEVLRWMLGQGLEATLRAYGGSPEQGLAVAREGAVALTRWTNGLRGALRARAGHENLMSALRRAAFARLPTDAIAADAPNGVLLVHAGIDRHRPLEAQGDALWWGGASFHRIDQPFENFRRLVRGYDPNHQGVQVTDFTATVDGGCGFGGRLAGICLTAAGEILELIEA